MAREPCHERPPRVDRGPAMGSPDVMWGGINTGGKSIWGAIRECNAMQMMRGGDKGGKQLTGRGECPLY